MRGKVKVKVKVKVREKGKGENGKASLLGCSFLRRILSA